MDGTNTDEQWWWTWYMIFYVVVWYDDWIPFADIVPGCGDEWTYDDPIID